MAKPLYQRIIDDLQASIDDGRYMPEDRLPTEAELMARYGTSRITATRALKEMELKGLIYRQKGRGSFVSPRKPVESRIISLVLPHKEGFFSGGQQYVRSISAACRKAGYLCSVHYSEQSVRRERRILEEIRRHGVSGIILYPIGNRNIDEISRLSLEGVPILLLDRSLEEIDLPVVRSENLDGAKTAVTHILNAGHRRIAFLGVLDAEPAALRYRGYCRALTDAGLPIDPALIHTRYPGDAGEDQEVLTPEEADGILAAIRSEGATACFCVNDLCAYRLVGAAERAGVPVPDGLSLVGFDHLSYLEELGLDLTTVAQDYAAMGRRCVELLSSLVERPEAKRAQTESVIVPTRFVPGSTVVGPPPPAESP